MYNECDIVKDLIPLYADKLASFGSRDLIEEHCANCEECKKELELAEKLIKTEEKDKPNNMDKVWANIAYQERRKTRRKRILIITVIFILGSFGLSLYSFIFHGNTWFTTVDLNVANSYESKAESHPGKDEVQAAAEGVKNFFEERFPGCILLNLSYSEGSTYNKKYPEYDDAIAFLSDYYILISDAATSGGDMMRKQWSWYVRYNYIYDKWEVVGYGYG